MTGEYLDFVDEIKISAKVEFKSSIDDFTGIVNVAQEKIKKKKEKPLNIENVDRRNTKKGLF